MTPTLPITDFAQAAARTAWGEARGEGKRGMQAVLNVIGNRATHPGWWGRDIAGVCQAHAQFSCWNTNDPNREKLLTVTDSDTHFREAMALASCLVKGCLPDLTGAADHYYDWRGQRPRWAQDRFYKCTIGYHRFYRVGLRGDGT